MVRTLLRSPTRSRLFPLAGVSACLLAELLLLALGVWRGDPPPPVTPLTVAAGLLYLGLGLIPVAVRPTRATAWAGCMSICVAFYVAIPFLPRDLPAVDRPLASVLPLYGIQRILNLGLMAALSFHAALHVPGGFQPDHSRVARRLPGVYLGTLGMIAVLLLASPGTLVPALGLFLVWCLGLMALAVGRLLRLSRSPDLQHSRPARQARVLLVGALLALLPTLGLRGLELLAGQPFVDYAWLLFPLSLFPLSEAYAILRHDLFGVDAAARRALVYTGVTTLTVALYLGLTVALAALSARQVRPFPGMASMFSLLVAAAAFDPLRRLVQRRVDGFFYPEKLAFPVAVARAQAALTQTHSRAEVAHILAHEFPRWAQAAWARVIFSEEAVQGCPLTLPPDCSWQSPLTAGDQVLGVFYLGPRANSPTYDAEEQAELARLIQAAGLALAYVDTIQALQELNQDLERRVARRTAQVVAQQRALAAHMTRRRLARDLHDSVTQTLFSLTLGLSNVARLWDADPVAARDLLAAQQRTARAALAEMRGLLDELQREHGEMERDSAPVDLAGRLRQMIAYLQQQTHLQVQLACPSAVMVPPDMADELVLLAREALHNVWKHAHTDRAFCHLSLEEGRLWLQVTDPGQGFHPDTAGRQGAHGLRSMAERAEALGGHLTVDSRPGRGTRVRFWMSWPGPLPESRPSDPCARRSIVGPTSQRRSLSHVC